MTTSIDETFKRTLLGDGVAMIAGLLDAAAMERLRACFEWGVSHPGPVFTVDARSDDDNVSLRDYGNPGAAELYRDAVAALPFAKLLQNAWGSEHVWYHCEEIFSKKGNTERLAWHQDTAYTPWQGEHWVNCWLSFESLPEAYAVQVIRGSHRGPLYEDAFGIYASESGETATPSEGEGPLLPDIEAQRQADPKSWDIVSFDVEPGDVIFFHPQSLHCGPETDEIVPERRTISLRFFGDKAYWSDTVESEGLGEEERRIIYGEQRGQPGEPYRDPRFTQLC